MWRTVTLSVKEEHINAPSPLAGVDALDAEYWGPTLILMLMVLTPLVTPTMKTRGMSRQCRIDTKSSSKIYLKIPEDCVFLLAHPSLPSLFKNEVIGWWRLQLVFSSSLANWLPRMGLLAKNAPPSLAARE